MNQSQDNKNNIVDTTDSLEAVAVFRSWKNVFFTITLLTLLLIQVSFWLVDTGFVVADSKKSSAKTVETKQAESVIIDTEAITNETEEKVDLAQIVENASADPNQTIQIETSKRIIKLDIKVTQGFIKILLRCSNFVLILSAVLYCLTILFSLKVSMLGRLGGINHISRAFFLSLIFLVLLLPWKQLTGGISIGYIFTAKELFADTVCVEDKNILSTSMHYLRYVAYWLINVLLLIFAQLRTCRWSKTILRRLEVI